MGEKKKGKNNERQNGGWGLNKKINKIRKKKQKVEKKQQKTKNKNNQTI